MNGHGGRNSAKKIIFFTQTLVQTLKPIKHNLACLQFRFFGFYITFFHLHDSWNPIFEYGLHFQWSGVVKQLSKLKAGGEWKAQETNILIYD